MTAFFISLDLDLAWQGGLAKEQGGELPRKIRSISFLPVFDFIRGTHVVLICTWIREGGEERKGFKRDLPASANMDDASHLSKAVS